MPPAHLLPERTASVLAVLYLLFNEGYAATAGADLVRAGLCAEAIRLARTLAQLMPDEPEALGLLALMLLHDARRAGRVDAAGDLVPLDDQDRSALGPGRHRRGRGRAGRPPSAGASRGRTRCRPPSPPATPPPPAPPTPTGPRSPGSTASWPASLPSPVVELNRAVAVAMADGPAAGLALVERLEASGALAGYHLLPATRADLLRRLDRFAEAADAYRQALALAANDADRRYLTRRLAEVS